MICAGHQAIAKALHLPAMEAFVRSQSLVGPLLESPDSQAAALPALELAASGRGGEGPAWPRETGYELPLWTAADLTWDEDQVRMRPEWPTQLRVLERSVEPLWSRCGDV